MVERYSGKPKPRGFIEIQPEAERDVIVLGGNPEEAGIREKNRERVQEELDEGYPGTTPTKKRKPPRSENNYDRIREIMAKRVLTRGSR